MNRDKLISLVMVMVVVASFGYVLTTAIVLYDGGVVPSQDIGIALVGILPVATANPFDCSMSLADVDNKKTFDYEKPTTIYKDYEIRDAYVDKGAVSLYYAPGKMCGLDAKYKSFDDGVIQYLTAIKDDGSNAHKFDKPMQYANTYKNESDYPDRITVTTIDGRTAMLWESGMEKNIFIDSDGSVIFEEEVPYPAQITIIDENTDRLYAVKGHTSLENLKEMIKSALPVKDDT